MAILTVPGASLYYEVHGDGPWLVFVHGAGGNHLSWWQQVPEFARHFRCLVLDQRGWGNSRCADPPDPRDFVTDLTALMDHLAVQDTTLVGQSMGGWTVMGCALRHPERVRHLVLTGTLGGLTDDAMVMQLIQQYDRSAAFDSHLALAPDFPAREPTRTFLYDQIAGLNPPPTAEFLGALVALRYTDEAQHLRVPVTFIAGARDRLFPLDIVRQAHAKIAAAELVVVPEAGHSAYFECPAEFNRTLGNCVG